MLTLPSERVEKDGVFSDGVLIAEDHETPIIRDNPIFLDLENYQIIRYLYVEVSNHPERKYVRKKFRSAFPCFE